MKNFLSVVLLAGLLGVTGCASDSNRSMDSNRPAETGQWQYRTFSISWVSEGEFRNKINALAADGWMLDSISHTTRSQGTAMSIVLMKRPSR